MTETRTIEVKAYRCPEDKPTCAAMWPDQVCRFMLARHFGLVECCGAVGADIARDNGHHGWLRPVDGCPVWGKQ